MSISSPIFLQMSMLEYEWVPTRWQRTAKLLLFLISLEVISTDVCEMSSMCDVVCFAGEIEDIPKIVGSLDANLSTLSASM